MQIIKDYKLHLSNIRRYVHFYKHHVIVDYRLPYRMIDIIASGQNICDNCVIIYHDKDGNVLKKESNEFPTDYISIDMDMSIENNIITWRKDKE